MIDYVAADVGARRYAVLVVDDEVEICKLLRMILQASYDVKTAGSVEQAGTREHLRSGEQADVLRRHRIGKNRTFTDCAVPTRAARVLRPGWRRLS